VFPLYHQVEIRDAADVDYPQWETGEELVLASAQCIVLATGPDLEGEVEIGVWVGADLVEEPVGGVVFDGSCSPRARGVLVGSSLIGELHSVPLPIGWHLVRVYADPSNPTRFNVWCDRQRAD
jgi:hypothetical protein